MVLGAVSLVLFAGLILFGVTQGNRTGGWWAAAGLFTIVVGNFFLRYLIPGENLWVHQLPMLVGVVLIVVALLQNVRRYRAVSS